MYNSAIQTLSVASVSKLEYCNSDVPMPLRTCVHSGPWMYIGDPGYTQETLDAYIYHSNPYPGTEYCIVVDKIDVRFDI